MWLPLLYTFSSQLIPCGALNSAMTSNTANMWMLSQEVSSAATLNLAAENGYRVEEWLWLQYDLQIHPQIDKPTIVWTWLCLWLEVSESGMDLQYLSPLFKCKTSPTCITQCCSQKPASPRAHFGPPGICIDKFRKYIFQCCRALYSCSKESFDIQFYNKVAYLQYHPKLILKHSQINLTEVLMSFFMVNQE